MLHYESREVACTFRPDTNSWKTTRAAVLSQDSRDLARYLLGGLTAELARPANSLVALSIVDFRFKEGLTPQWAAACLVANTHLSSLDPGGLSYSRVPFKADFAPMRGKQRWAVYDMQGLRLYDVRDDGHVDSVLRVPAKKGHEFKHAALSQDGQTIFILDEGPPPVRSSFRSIYVGTTNLISLRVAPFSQREQPVKFGPFWLGR